MATNFDPEEANIKLFSRVMICWPKVLRRLLKQHITKTKCSVAHFMSSFAHKVDRRKHKGNYEDLFVKSKPIDEWDISLIFFVIKLACPALLKLKTTDLDDLRIIRNSVCHPEGSGLSINLFQNMWTKLDLLMKEALEQLNDSDLEIEIKSDEKYIEKGVNMKDLLQCHSQIFVWYQQEMALLERIEDLKEGIYFLFSNLFIQRLSGSLDFGGL